MGPEQRNHTRQREAVPSHRWPESRARSSSPTFAVKRLSLVFVANRAGLSTAQLLAIFSGEYDPDLSNAVGSRRSTLLREDGPTLLD